MSDYVQANATIPDTRKWNYSCSVAKILQFPVISGNRNHFRHLTYLARCGRNAEFVVEISTICRSSGHISISGFAGIPLFAVNAVDGRCRNHLPTMFSSSPSQIRRRNFNAVRESFSDMVLTSRFVGYFRLSVFDKMA